MVPRRLWLPLCLIVLTLGGQLSVSAYSLVHKLRAGDTIHHRSWPFFDYPMYSQSAGPPVTASTVELWAEFEDGSRQQLSPGSMGLSEYAWRYHVVERLVAKPAVDGASPGLAELIESHREQATHVAVSATREKPRQLVVERTIHQIVGREFTRREVRQSVNVKEVWGE